MVYLVFLSNSNLLGVLVFVVGGMGFKGWWKSGGCDSGGAGSHGGGSDGAWVGCWRMRWCGTGCHGGGGDGGWLG